jgi:hypothetical protein
MHRDPDDDEEAEELGAFETAMQPRPHPRIRPELVKRLLVRSPLAPEDLRLILRTLAREGRRRRVKNNLDSGG